MLVLINNRNHSMLAKPSIKFFYRDVLTEKMKFSSMLDSSPYFFKSLNSVYPSKLFCDRPLLPKRDVLLFSHSVNSERIEVP